MASAKWRAANRERHNAQARASYTRHRERINAARRTGEPNTGRFVRREGVGYGALHARVWKDFGKASEYDCMLGDHPAEDWANMTGDYEDQWDYLPLCRRHHRAYDRR